MEKSIKLTVRAGNTWKISRTIRHHADGVRALAAVETNLHKHALCGVLTCKTDSGYYIGFDSGYYSGGTPEAVLSKIEEFMKTAGLLTSGAAAYAVPPEGTEAVSTGAQTPERLDVLRGVQEPAIENTAFLKAVDRLEKEKNELEERWEREGKADGREWALQASYEDLDIVSDAAHDALELPAVVEDIIREEVALKEEPALYREESSARMFWLFGWLDGVMEAWMEIHDEMSRRQCAQEGVRAA